MSKPQPRKAQEEDADIGVAIHAIKHGCWPEGMSPELTRLNREAGKLAMKEGLLYRYSQRPSGDVVSQLVLPREFREMVMHAVHYDLGHIGQERTVDLLRDRLFWPRMVLQVEESSKTVARVSLTRPL